MIKKFRHKGLARSFTTGSVSGIQPAHAKRLKPTLGRLQASTNPKDMDLPGLRLHELKGRDKGRWSVWVNDNWRVTFKLEGVDADDVDYEDHQ